MSNNTAKIRAFTSRGWIDAANLSTITGCSRKHTYKRIRRFLSGGIDEEQWFAPRQDRFLQKYFDGRGNDEWRYLSNKPRDALLQSIPGATPAEIRFYGLHAEKYAGKQHSVQEIMRAVGCGYATAYWRLQHYLNGEWSWQDCLRPVRRK